MYVYVVYNDIAYILQYCDATTTHNVDIGSTSIQGLVAVEDELLGKLCEHVLREHYPQRLCRDHRVPQRPRLRVHSVVVRAVGDNVVLAVLSCERVLPESNRAIG